MADFINLPLRNESGAFHVVVEAPRGSKVKMKYDPTMNAFVFGRALPLGVAYPYDWGFFPSTCADDGDPLDAMILFEAATWPGSIVAVKPIGIVRVVQRDERKGPKLRNDRVIVTPIDDPRHKHVRDLPDRMIRELEQFFATASALTGKVIEIGGWDGPKQATRAIVAAAERYVKRGLK